MLANCSEAGLGGGALISYLPAAVTANSILVVDREALCSLPPLSAGLFFFFWFEPVLVVCVLFYSVSPRVCKQGTETK